MSAFWSRDISICESRHQHSGLVAGSVATVFFFFFCLDNFFFCYVVILAILSCDISILAQFLALSRQFLDLSRQFFFFTLSRHFFCSAASFFSPTCQGHNFFVLTRIWTCKDSLKRSLNLECNHGGI